MVSKRLVQLDCETPLDVPLEDLEVREADPEPLMDFLTKMEFRTITQRVATHLGIEAPVVTEGEQTQNKGAEPDAPPIDPDGYECVRTMEDLQKWIGTIYSRGWVAVDTETTSLNEMLAEIVGICLSVNAGEACYIPLIHKAAASDDLFGSD